MLRIMKLTFTIHLVKIKCLDIHHKRDLRLDNFWLNQHGLTHTDTFILIEFNTHFGQLDKSCVSQTEDGA